MPEIENVGVAAAVSVWLINTAVKTALSGSEIAKVAVAGEPESSWITSGTDEGDADGDATGVAVGTSFTGLTVTVNTRVVVSNPSDIVRVIVEVPL